MRGVSWGLLVVVLCAATVGQTSKMSEAEQAIREADKAWSQAAQNKDLDKTVSFYADDASALPFNAPIATGKDQIKQLWSNLMAKPGFSLTFAPTKIDVAKSGELAYEVGTFELKMNDAQGNPTTIPGKYVVAWKRQSNADWKVELDIFNTDK
jgi:ketosteroid isomerase-like protein